MNHSMTWADFYLICFAVGFCFSFFSFVFGGSRTGRLHLPHFHGHAGGAHLPSSGVSGTHGAVTAAHAPVAGEAHAAASSTQSQQAGGVSPFNFVTLTAFLAWFGGAGYLLTRYSGLWVGFGLLVSVASGLVGGGMVFLFLSKVLISEEENMDPADYEMVGVLGRVSSSIRESGTGEIIYTQMGTRRVCGARSEDASAIAKGTEVVVTRYEKGIAYVRLWSEMSGDE
jgi:membrane protein implicated in regulation of membrane protease activity